MDVQDCPQLTLEYQGTSVKLAADSDERLTLGTARECDLVGHARFTSRHHAYLECRNQDFYLVDHSTNGSFVQTEDEQVTRVHRSSLRLWGRGYIGLGEPLHSSIPVVFKQDG